MYKDGKLITTRKRPSPFHLYIARDLTSAFLEEETLIKFLDISENKLQSNCESVKVYVKNNYIIRQPNPNTHDNSGKFMDEYPNETEDEIAYEIIESYWRTMNEIRKEFDIIEYAYKLIKGQSL